MIGHVNRKSNTPLTSLRETVAVRFPEINTSDTLASDPPPAQRKYSRSQHTALMYAADPGQHVILYGGNIIFRREGAKRCTILLTICRITSGQQVGREIEQPAKLYAFAFPEVRVDRLCHLYRNRRCGLWSLDE